MSSHYNSYYTPAGTIILTECLLITLWRTLQTTSEHILLYDPACMSRFVVINQTFMQKLMSQTSMFFCALFQLEKSL